VKPERLSFPYDARPSAIFGTIHRPVAAVELYSWTLHQWIACTMVVDSGADYCVLPSRVALHLGLEPDQGQRYTASGIGGQQTVWLYPGVRLRVGPWELRVPIGVVERDDLPPLLGRYRCVDVFDLRLHRFTTTFSVGSRAPTYRPFPPPRSG